ncbi:MAG: FHA domain-containing protein [Chloroflexota bacterium]|nr:FHA domain-containing protein [Chloroflexota bacterium]
MDQIQFYWYTWGALIAFLISLLATLGVFFDAHRKHVGALAWKMLTVIAVVLILPSVLLALFQTLQFPLANALLPLALLGIIAALLALLALLLSLAGVGAGMRCANCGRPRDPTWPYCPHCEYDKPIAAVPTVEAFVPPAPDYPPATLDYQPPTVDLLPTAPAAPVPSDKTMQLGATGEPIAQGGGETRVLRAQPSSLVYLVIRSGVHEGTTFQLGETTNIGRKADLNDIVLDDDAVSRQHARVRFEEGKFVFYDLASANGSFIQDPDTGEWKRTQHRQLKDGMMVKVGETILGFMEVKAGKEG